MKKMGRSWFFAHFVFVFLKFSLILSIFLPNFTLDIGLILLSLEVVTFSLFLLISFKDPGYENETFEIAELYATIKPDFICPYCTVKRVHTTVHCHHCKRCVKVKFN